MIKDVVIGISGYFRHLSLVRKNSLGRFFLAPMLIGILLMATVGTSAYGLGDDLGGLMLRWYPFEKGISIVETISSWVGGLLIFVVGLILAKYIIIILASPFMSPMSEKIEANSTHNPTLPSQSLSAVQGIWRGVRISFGSIIKELAITIVLLILSVIIPVISPITAVLIFIVQAYYAGSGNMDYTLERYYGVRDSKRFIRSNRGLAIGNGLVFVFLLMLGLGFFIAPPLGTLAVTPEVIKRLEKY